MIEVKEKRPYVLQEGDRFQNEICLEFDAISCNESFARVAVAAFIAPLNPTMEEVSDVKTAVSEAVTNAIIHGYENTYGYGKHGQSSPVCCPIHEGKVYLRCRLSQGILYVEIEDKGVGIDNLSRAMEPLFTTRPELERSGMGFAFMEAFMDDLEVESQPGRGTIVKMKKKLGSGGWLSCEEEG